MGGISCKICCAECLDAVSLDLFQANLVNVPKRVFKTKSLQFLSLACNRIKELPADIRQLTQLTSLSLWCNELTRLPAEISNLRALTRLDCSNNRLERLPASIGQLTNLEVLDVSFNLLVALPDSIGQCRSLRELKAKQNRLVELPNDLGDLRLQELNLEQNPLSPTLQRFLTIPANQVTNHILSFLRYRKSHQLDSRFECRVDRMNRQYFADHTNQATSWVDPRYFLYVRHLALRERTMFDMTGEPNDLETSDPAPTEGQCQSGHCHNPTVPNCSYRLCSRCCHHPDCPAHGSAELVGGESLRSFTRRADRLRDQLRVLHPPEPETWRDKPRLRLNVRRPELFEDSFRDTMRASPERLKLRLNVCFSGEDGLDYGGLTREWFELISKEMCNPNYCLFTYSEIDNYTFRINPLSGINPEHLQYFRFVGRIVGKALFDGFLISCYFTTVFYKRLLNIPLCLNDMEAIDPEYYRSLKWILENDITDILDLTFTTEVEEFGATRTIELKENGASIPVTEENKDTYVHLLTDHLLNRGTREQMDAIKRGFHDLVPEPLVHDFNPAEIELLLCGVHNIDVQDWRANAEYRYYSPTSPVIVWFWRCVEAMANDDRAKLLQFVTGTSKVPQGGFANLVGSNGPRKFQICKAHKSPNHLPVAHTCFNQLDLPEYRSFEELSERTHTAIEVGLYGFGEK